MNSRDFFYMEQFIKSFVDWMEATNYSNHPHHEYTTFSIRFTKRDGHYRIEPNNIDGDGGITLGGAILFNSENKTEVAH